MDNARLEQHIKWSKWILLGVIVATVGAYIWRFHAGILSAEADAWGQFGDYLGGVMNPLIAFGAFYWLATSVMLQKSELSDTKNALVASQLAQQQQAHTALLTVQIQSANIELSNVSMRLNQLNERLHQLYLYQGEHGPARLYFDEEGGQSSVSEVIGGVREQIRSIQKDENLLLEQVYSLSEKATRIPGNL